MTEKKHKMDDEIYVLGSTGNNGGKPSNKRKWIIGCVIIGVALLSAGVWTAIYFNKDEEYYYEPEREIEQQHTNDPQEEIKQAYIEVLEETVNDVPLLIYIPHNARLELAIERPSMTDSTAIFVAQAADIRQDNHQIVGDFVLKGKQIARGQRKQGFCAVIGDDIVIGIAEETTYLEKTIAKGGYFFRQYPLVHNGNVMENEPKNKAIRKAIAKRGQKIVMIESRSRESFHDFSQALADVGVSNAIYLVGGNSFGWYYTAAMELITVGDENPRGTPRGTNYLVWRIK